MQCLVPERTVELEKKKKLTRAFQRRLGTFPSELFGDTLEDTELPLTFLTWAYCTVVL